MVIVEKAFQAKAEDTAVNVPQISCRIFTHVIKIKRSYPPWSRPIPPQSWIAAGWSPSASAQVVRSSGPDSALRSDKPEKETQCQKKKKKKKRLNMPTCTHSYPFSQWHGLMRFIWPRFTIIILTWVELEKGQMLTGFHKQATLAGMRM